MDQTWRISPSLSRWTCRLPSVFSCGPRPHNRRRKPREYPQSELPKTLTPCQLLILLLEESIRHSSVVWFTTVSTQLADGLVCCLFLSPFPKFQHLVRAGNKLSLNADAPCCEFPNKVNFSANQIHAAATVLKDRSSCGSLCLQQQCQ